MPNLLSLHEIFCEHAIGLKGNSVATVKSLQRSFSDFMKHSNVSYANELDLLVFEKWLLEGKLKRNWAAKTIRIHMGAMSVFCDWLVERDYLPENPIRRIPKPKLPKHLPKSLTLDQATTLLDCTRHLKYTYAFERHRAMAILGLLIFTGIRKKELLSLKLLDVDIENKTLFVNGGKGDKDRVIPLNSRICQILKKYLETRSARKPQSVSFFLSHRFDKPMGEKTIILLFNRIKEMSGIKFSAHPLRHTFATLMLQGGCDIYSLSKMMGHSDIKTTTIYLSATTEQLQKQVLKHPLNF